VLKTEAIRQTLEKSGNFHLTKLYDPGMEVQVNVSSGKGKRIVSQYLGKPWSGWTDGITTWKSFRIPYNADTNPTYEDRDIQFNLSDHAEAIGLTGWNWIEKESYWVGFDFDSLVNHEKTGMSDEELNKIKEVCYNIDYVTIVKSTSGKGLHLYIHIEKGFKTNTHCEHAALAKSILSLLSLDIGYNLQNSVDVCGGILWVYHTKQFGTDGFTLIKEGSKLPINRIPINWKDYILSNTHKTSTAKNSLTKSEAFKELYSSIKNNELNEEHKKVLDWFKNAPVGTIRDFWWDIDHQMFVCHTLDLLAAHKELKLRGIFYTNSSGSSRQNCFMFPEIDGSWTVRRHGREVNEHPYWFREGSGWTTCSYNLRADLTASAKSNNCVKNSKGELVFTNHIDGLKTLKDIEVVLEIDEYIKSDPNPRTLIIKEKDSSVTVYLATREGERVPKGFIKSKKGFVETTIDYIKNKRENLIPDGLVRYTISNGMEAGWFVSIKKSWIAQSKSNVATVLMGELNINKQEVENLLGKTILHPWYLVNKPFQSEYLGSRSWNREAAKFKILPIEGNFNTWLSIFSHCGYNLNDSVLNNEWCSQSEILSGSDYLICWIANLFQRPEFPLPYLFFVGEQNTGKSTLHEAIGQFLISSGYTRADNALTSQGGFNNEISNAVLCVVEETDLRKNKEAGNRIKDWVTGRTISIRALYKNSYDIANRTHWIQCANDINYCIITTGDTRVLIIRVNKIESEIPKHILFSKLEEEAPAFLHYLLNIELPDPQGRLAMPCLETIDKQELTFNNKTDLEQFVETVGIECKGHFVEFDNLYNMFIDWLQPEKRTFWSKIKFSKDFPKIGLLCKGKFSSENLTIIGNYSLNKHAESKDFVFKLNMETGRLVQS
jgi:hypothetical protein